jgi:hypothetical protein
MKSKSKLRVKFTSLLWVAAAPGVLAFLLAQTGNPQQIVEPPLAGLYLSCPTHVLAPGQPITLLAKVVGIPGDKEAKLILYRWEVSVGKIVAGQGTSKVTVDTSNLTSISVDSVSVKVVIDGGPPELQREKSCTLKIDPTCPLPILFDEYHDISLKVEQPRLDRLGKYLTSECPKTAAFVVAYAGWKYCLGEAEWRANRVKKYLVDKYKIDANRIITVDGGYRDNLTVDIFISTYASCGPFPTPSLVSRTKYLTGSCADKYKEIVNH